MSNVYWIAINNILNISKSIQTFIQLYIFRKAGEFYSGNELLPVYDWSPKVKKPIEIFEILIKPAEDATTCKILPHCISHNVCFLVDATHLKSQNDWKSDDMGSWKNNGVQHLPFVLQDEMVYSADEIQSECDGKLYTMKRIYFKNKSSPDVREIVSFLEGTVIVFLW